MRKCEKRLCLDNNWSRNNYEVLRASHVHLKERGKEDEAVSDSTILPRLSRLFLNFLFPSEVSVSCRFSLPPPCRIPHSVTNALMSLHLSHLQ